MNCEQLVSYLSDYIDNNLDEELRLDAQEHLATCQNCRVVLDTTQRTIFLYCQTGSQLIQAGRRDALFEKLQDAFSLRKSKTGPEKDQDDL